MACSTWGEFVRSEGAKDAEAQRAAAHFVENNGKNRVTFFANDIALAEMILNAILDRETELSLAPPVGHAQQLRPTHLGKLSARRACLS
jgi:hypothetical protein